MKKLVVILLLLVSICVLGVLWEAFRFLAGHASSSSEQEVVFDVNPGDGFYKIAERLEQQGLVTSAFYFKILAKVSGYATKLKVGEYAVKTDLRPIEILDLLSSGKSIERQMTFPEGWNMYEIANQVASKGLGTKDEFLSLTRNPKLVKELLGEEHESLEGYLFPETYSYTKFTPPEILIRGMVERFKSVYGQIEVPQDVALNRHQIVTLASVIEKETGAEEERPRISSVFHNRLKKGMRLQSDPTILYGILAETGVMKENITREDILRPTEYNTYTVKALPKGPISNPGREALAAAVRPEKTPYFFFVSKNDGTHTFSESLGEHNSAVQKFQVDRKAREGKSWRDLKKKAPAPTKKKKQ